MKDSEYRLQSYRIVHHVETGYSIRIAVEGDGLVVLTSRSPDDTIMERITLQHEEAALVAEALAEAAAESAINEERTLHNV